MTNLRQLEEGILADGRVNSQELETLRREVYANGKIDRAMADFLVALFKRVEHPNPGFVHFYYRAIKDHMLSNGGLSKAKVDWLRRMLFADGWIDDEERRLLHELKGEAKEHHKDFDVLFHDCMKKRHQQHASV